MSLARGAWTRRGARRASATLAAIARGDRGVERAREDAVSALGTKSAPRRALEESTRAGEDAADDVATRRRASGRARDDVETRERRAGTRGCVRARA